MKTIKMMVLAFLAMVFAGAAQAALTDYELREYNPAGVTCVTAHEYAAIEARRGHRASEVHQQQINKCNEVAKVLATRNNKQQQAAPTVTKAGFTPWWKKR